MHVVEQIPQLPIRTQKSWQQYLIDSLLAAGGAGVVTGIIDAFHLYPTIPNISIVYLLLILALASTRGRYAALLAAVVALLSFDFFLVPPLYTFVMYRVEEWLALLVFLVTALLTSQLATVMRQRAEEARLSEREARILYEVGRVINSTEQLEEQLDIIVLSLVRVFSSWGVRECGLLLPDTHGALTLQAEAPIRVERFRLSSDEMAVTASVFAQGKMSEQPSALSTPQASPDASGKGAVLRMIPLKTGERVLGVLCLRLQDGVSWSSSEQGMQEEQKRPTGRMAFFWTFLDQAILIIERAQLRTKVMPNNEY
jgi:K+-sensing histidine kinase KdpD